MQMSNLQEVRRKSLQLQRIYNVCLCRRLANLLYRIACIEPYVFPQRLDSVDKRRQGIGVHQRVASGECHIEILLLDNVNDFIDAHRCSTCGVPGIGVMTSRAMVCASGEIYGSAKSRTIHRCSTADVQDIEVYRRRGAGCGFFSHFGSGHGRSLIMASRAAMVARSTISSVEAFTLMK